MKDKELTKAKLIKAVGEVIKADGFKNLKVSKIAKIAEVDRKLIYRYFGNLNYLIEAYILENDYWMVFADQMKQALVDKEYSGSEQLIIEILQNQFKFFSSQKEMQPAQRYLHCRKFKYFARLPKRPAQIPDRAKHPTAFAQ